MSLAELRRAIAAATRADEARCVRSLLAEATLPPPQFDAAGEVARRLVETLRARRSRSGGVDALMREFSLSGAEGVALMCLAEALLRIPDAATADALIRDKVSRGDWRSHLGRSRSLFVNAAAWGLMITGNLVATHSDEGLGRSLTQLIARGGEPLIRKGVDMAMRLLGQQFVTGQTIDEALANARDRRRQGYRYTFEDGEGSLGAEAEVSLPLSPQLELEGQIGGEAGDRLADMAKQVALTAYPFAPADPRYPREKAYGLAEAALRFLRVQIALQAQQAALDLQARGMERELARRTLELEDRKSALAELRLARGEISFQDAQDQRVALSEARRRLFDSELASLRDWKTLQVLFAPGTDDVALAPLSLGELREFVAARAARLAALRGQAPSSQKLETLRLELAALRAEWGATPVFRPDGQAQTVRRESCGGIASGRSGRGQVEFIEQFSARRFPTEDLAVVVDGQ